MKCFRCGRIMAFEKFYGPHGYFFGWRCITCGEIVDPVILENRLGQRRRSPKNNFLDPDSIHGILHGAMGPEEENNSH